MEVLMSISRIEGLNYPFLNFEKEATTLSNCLSAVYIDNEFHLHVAMICNDAVGGLCMYRTYSYLCCILSTPSSYVVGVDTLCMYVPTCLGGKLCSS
jgi:hypothetical protein